MRSLFPRGTLVLLGLVCACTDATSPANFSDDELLRDIAAMGFRVSDVKIAGPKFVVEGDIVLDRLQLEARHRRNLSLPEIPSRNGAPPVAVPLRLQDQWLAKSGAASNTGTHVVDVSAIADQPTWVQAVRSAMAEWNAIPGAAIGWVEGSGSGAVHVIRGTCEGGSGTVACGDFPLNGSVGANLTINNGGSFPGLDASHKVFTMAHELGHTIGFRHTNWQGNGELLDGATIVGNSPATDAASVMNGGTGALPWNGFSQWDQYSAAFLYNLPDFTVTYSASGPTASWASQANVVYYHAYYLYITWPRDEFGTPTWHQDQIDLGTTTGTSVVIQDADTGDNQCGNGVWVDAYYPSGATNSGFVNVATCSSANYP
jgi:hypothetical protein